MTLVVGRVDGPRIAIVSDTLITEHNRPLAFQDGVVKSCMFARRHLRFFLQLTRERRASF
jgi:hypothetical protein